MDLLPVVGHRGEALHRMPDADDAEASSIHAVVNSGGSFGTLLLATSDAGLTEQSLADVLETNLGSTQQVVINGQPLQKATDSSGRTGHAWIRNGVAGVFLSNSLQAGEHFLEQYFRA